MHLCAKVHNTMTRLQELEFFCKQRTQQFHLHFVKLGRLLFILAPSCSLSLFLPGGALSKAARTVNAWATC
jgi:hypothetical protein